jgi:hypothetical protein
MAISDFLLPKPHGLKARTSSITNASINGVLPIEHPSDDEVNQALEFFGQRRGDSLNCVYCGDPATEWDHLRPLIEKKKPTGNYTHIKNLVPACGKCNQSKGNKDWQSWMFSRAKLSPKSRNKSNLEKRAEKIACFVEWGAELPKIDLEKLAGTKLWNEYLEAVKKISHAIEIADSLAKKIQEVSSPARVKTA